eukprot:6542909-Alexandrium_andersonii.AAC.1
MDSSSLWQLLHPTLGVAFTVDAPSGVRLRCLAVSRGLALGRWPRIATWHDRAEAIARGPGV